MSKLYMRQYWRGSALYHAIDCSRWNPRGEVLRMNPTNKTIDRCFQTLRGRLRGLHRAGHLRIVSNRFIPVASRSHDSWVSLPLRGAKGYAFTPADMVYARSVMKKHKKVFEKLLNWNDIDRLAHLLRCKKVRKPKLTAQIIFAAWTYQKGN